MDSNSCCGESFVRIKSPVSTNMCPNENIFIFILMVAAILALTYILLGNNNSTANTP